mgnify:CR=1 FL=1
MEIIDRERDVESDVSTVHSGRSGGVQGHRSSSQTAESDVDKRKRMYRRRKK